MIKFILFIILLFLLLFIFCALKLGKMSDEQNGIEKKDLWLK